MIDIKTREIVSHAAFTERNGNWWRNHLRSVFSLPENVPDILIADRDLAYGKWLKPFLHDNYGVQLRQIPPYMPVFNAFAERMVRTFREEITDRLIFYNRDDLDRVLTEYVSYYNTQRPHASLELDAPLKKLDAEASKSSVIRRRKIINGLVTHFERTA